MRQGQGLVITPQLQQAIKLLQLSNLELEAFVEAEMERNPLLDHEDREASVESESADSSVDAASTDTVSDHNASQELDAPHEDVFQNDGPSEGANDADPAFGMATTDWSRSNAMPETDEEFGSRLRREKTLQEHLCDQLAVASLDTAGRAIAHVLIDEVDEGGYLRADLAETSDRLGCDLLQVEAVLKVLQGFEPTGVFARSVPECLALQLREKNRLDPAMQALLDNLELLARRDHASLRKVCEVSDEDLKDMLSELRALTPRPGAAFGSEPIQAVTPDVIVREGPGGIWIVDLNTETLPKVLVDQRYHAQISSQARSDQEKTFLSDCLTSANWLVKSLDQRARTILKVSCEIVRQQDAFLAHGVRHLRPLNLKTVAEAIGMHESTVSRVTSNKYMATPRGVLELKFFFTSAISSSEGGEAHSAESVRHRIRQLIDTEKAEADVYSDDRIVEILKEAGVDIARRTVAKYREAMRIPSSVQRRRQLRQSA
jgi:RNA polymerase sigma-54 factor